jgi:hypothetical protein
LQTEQQKASLVKYYGSKELDAKLYAVLQERIARFITIDKLQDMAHDLDTNMNEAFNQICTWFLPKNKVYAGSYSLHNRLSFAVGINSIGLVEFFKRLFRKMGITMTNNVLYFLQKKEDYRVKKFEKSQTPAAKRHKNKMKYEYLKKKTLIAKMEFHKRAGTYRRGMNLDLPLSMEQPVAKPSTSSSHCEYCGRKGHATTRSKKCLAAPGSEKLYRKNGSLLTEPDPDDQSDDDDSSDCSNFDAMPLVADPEEESVEQQGAQASLYLLAGQGSGDSDDRDANQASSGII